MVEYHSAGTCASGYSIFPEIMINLELIRLIRHEMTDTFLDEFKRMMTSTVKEHKLDVASLDITVAIVDQLYSLPDRELSEWFCDKDGIGWEIIFNAIIDCITNYIRMRHTTDGEWILGNPAI